MDGLEAQGREVGGQNGRGKVGDDPPGGPSCTNDAKALTSLARRSAKEFAVDMHILTSRLRTGSMLVLTTEDMGEIVDM